jgi:hypothetical protein
MPTPVDIRCSRVTAEGRKSPEADALIIATGAQLLVLLQQPHSPNKFWVDLICLRPQSTLRPSPTTMPSSPRKKSKATAKSTKSKTKTKDETTPTKSLLEAPNAMPPPTTPRLVDFNLDEASDHGDDNDGWLSSDDSFEEKITWSRHRMRVTPGGFTPRNIQVENTLPKLIFTTHAFLKWDSLGRG